MKHLKRLIFIFFLLAVCAGTFSCSATPQRIYYLLKYKNNYNIKSDSPTIHSLKEILEKNEKIKFYPNNSLTLLQTGDEVLSRMYRLIESANSEICIDQYIFRNDEVGIDFFKLLQQKSESGVKVRIIIDKLGSFGPSFYYSKYLKSASKIQLRFFNPVLWWSIIKINNRDHSKLLIVDSKTAVISGIGLGKEYKYWRDIGVEIQGPVLFDIKKKFEETWRKSGYGWFGKDIPFPGLNELKSEFDKLFLKKIKIDDSLKNNLQGSADARLLQASPDFSNRIVFETFLKAINSSSNYVYITNSYFLPNKLFRNSLINAVKRGVDVKIILPSKTDLPLLRRTSHLY
ncbi:MAG TPA: phosphatidylserine/phosphatidylglycerophosphate/cardiolipin synthase family protein, partial [bacterium]|nr:phosphatidylserine/phosphatidylglycerophosphate/cardiolipin synthase family protein [bacterium]